MVLKETPSCPVRTVDGSGDHFRPEGHVANVAWVGCVGVVTRPQHIGVEGLLLGRMRVHGRDNSPHNCLKETRAHRV